MFQYDVGYSPRRGERKLRCSLVMALVITSLSNCDETTQQYLENAVRNLKNLRQLQTSRLTELAEVAKDPPVGPKVHRRSQQYADNAPPLSLTKGELASLYEQAIAKGETLKLDTGGHEYVDALVHHLDEDQPPESHSSSGYTQTEPQHDYAHHDAPSEDAGYYYYYYPIKSFLDEITSQPAEEHTASLHKPSYHHKELTTYKPPFTYHSHHHQHNVTIQTAEPDKKEAKPMEPLFMAISGFIGMAVMFVLSMVVLPKFGIKPKVIHDIKKKEKLDDFARFALNAIEGHCAERFACELTKTARSFEMEDNRFYKLLKRVAPGTFGRYINNSGKYANKQLQCTAIPCNRKRPNNNNNNKNVHNKKPTNPNQKKKTSNGNKKY